MKILLNGQWKQYRVQLDNYNCETLVLECTIPLDLQSALCRITGKSECRMDLIAWYEDSTGSPDRHLNFAANVRRGDSFDDCSVEFPVRLTNCERKTAVERVEWGFVESLPVLSPEFDFMFYKLSKRTRAMRVRQNRRKHRSISYFLKI